MDFNTDVGDSLALVYLAKSFQSYMHAVRRLPGPDRPANGSMLGSHGTWWLLGTDDSAPSWPG